MWTSIAHETRGAIRRLSASPGYAALSVAILGAGIGAAAGAYAAIRAVILPPAYTSALEHTVNIYQRDPRSGGSASAVAFSWLEYDAIQSGTEAIETVFAYASFRHPVVTPSNEPKIAWGELVSGSYFDALELRPAIGRLLRTDDDVPGVTPVAVISHTLWQTAFGGAPSAVGSVISVNGHLFEVVGVAPRYFRGLYSPEVLPNALWVPLAHAPQLSAPGQQFSTDFNQWTRRWLFVRGRMRHDAAPQRAALEVESIASRLDREYPVIASGNQLPPGSVTRRQWVVIPATDIRLNGQDRFVIPFASAAMAALMVVVLCACTNVASLTSTRMRRRRQEILVKVAIGASHARVIREQLTESAVLSVLSCVVGLGVAYALTNILSGQIVLGNGITFSIEPVFDGTVIVIGLLLALMTFSAAGLAPVVSVVRRTLKGSLRQDGETITPEWAARKRLIALQTAAVVLLCTAGVICALRVEHHFQSTGGILREGLAVLEVTSPSSSSADVDALAVALDRVAGLIADQPPVQSVAVASSVPPFTDRLSAVVSTVDTRASVRLVLTDSQLFTTLGLRLLSGRPFDSRDLLSDESVAIVSRSLADRLLPHGDPVKAQIEYEWRLDAGEPMRATTTTIVGVVDDVGIGAGVDREAVLYVPLRRDAVRSLTLVARTSGKSGSIAQQIVRAVRLNAPDFPIVLGGAAEDLLLSQAFLPRAGRTLMAVLAVAALVLTLVGMYGALGAVVTARRREMGIRAALGASDRQIIRFIVRDGMTPVIIGAALGAGLAVAGWSSVESLLRQSTPVPLRALAVTGITGAILAIAYVACRAPAQRATRVSPGLVLREL